MSREKRKFSSTGLYHIVFRGINRQNLFEEAKDYRKIKEILQKQKEKQSFEIYAYCLMSNHVHMFIKEKEIGDIVKIMHKILTSYVGWYNIKYQRSGSLIGNRYKSEPIEDDKYVFAVIRYIHQNPIKAGMVENIVDYEWSSYKEYVEKIELVDENFLIGILDSKKVRAKEIFVELHKETELENFQISDRKKLTDSQVKRKIIKVIKTDDVKSIAKLPKEERNKILCILRQEENLSIGQLERVTGISRGIITRSVQKQARP